MAENGKVEGLPDDAAAITSLAVPPPAPSTPESVAAPSTSVESGDGGAGRLLPDLQLAQRRGEGLRLHALPHEGTVTIGRAWGNTIRVHDPCVSRSHAALHMGISPRIEHLSGTNKTQVRRASPPGDAEAGGATVVDVADPVEVGLGDQILVGTTILEIRRAIHSDRLDPLREAELLVTMPERPGIAPPPPKTMPPSDDSGPSGPPSESLEDMYLDTEGLRPILEQARNVARTQLHIILRGEIGTGRTRLAAEIHAASSRARRPLHSLSLAPMKDDHIERELFGFEKGAFPGARAEHPGLLELATGSTLVLEDIDVLPRPLQTRLRVALDEKRVLRIGGTTVRSIHVRIIATSTRDLHREVARKKFSDHLRVVLNGKTLVIPPLRERAGDIVPLADAFLLTVCRATGKTRLPTFSADALSALCAHLWPGNLTELRNVVFRAASTCVDGVVSAADLDLEAHPGPPSLSVERDGPPSAPPRTTLPTPAVVVFFSANPSSTTRLRLDEEYREICDRMESAPAFNHFKLVAKPAAQIDDLQPALNRYRPTVVHFSGHGVPGEQIILHDANDTEHAVGKDELASLFHGSGVRLVVLNACFSSAEAEAIVAEVDCAIGMTTDIGDAAARKFSSAFYAALAFGRSVKAAFEQGLTAMKFYGAPASTPKLLTRSGVDPDQVVLVER